MQPWMLIAALLGGCLVLLIVAPRLHRRSLARAVSRAEEARSRRIEELRSRPNATETVVPETLSALLVRDTLLLRGVRAEIVGIPGSTVLVHAPEDAATVRAVIAALAGGPG